MKHWVILFIGLIITTTSHHALAHDVPPSVFNLDIGSHSIGLDMQLQLKDLSTALQIPAETAANDVIKKYGDVIQNYIQEKVKITTQDNSIYQMHIQSMTLSLTNNANWTSNEWINVHADLEAPQNASTEIFTLTSAAIIDHVMSHKTMVFVRRDLRNQLLGQAPMLIGIIDFGSQSIHANGSDGSWWKGFSHLFNLGMKHIAEGTDHVLFLLILLLPAPLLSRSRRWQRHTKSIPATFSTIFKVVSGFTIGHSLTLAIAALSIIKVNAQLVEVCIAVSILVSSLHAWRPIFANKEFFISSAFGLVHGLAFAEVLTSLSFDTTTLAVSLIGFNLGIEAMQLMIVAVVLPILVLLSRTSVYPLIRIVGAIFGTCCAIGWILERAVGTKNPLAPILDWLAPPPDELVIIMIATSILALGLLLRPKIRSLKSLTFVITRPTE